MGRHADPDPLVIWAIRVDMRQHVGNVCMGHIHAAPIVFGAVPLRLAQHVDQSLRSWLDVIGAAIDDPIPTAAGMDRSGSDHVATGLGVKPQKLWQVHHERHGFRQAEIQMLAAVATAGFHDHAGASYLRDGLDQPGVTFLPAVAAVDVDDQQPLAQDTVSGLEPSGFLDVVQLFLVPVRRNLPVSGARVLEWRLAVRVAAVAPPFAVFVAGRAIERENVHTCVPQVAIRLAFRTGCCIVHIASPLGKSTCPRP